MRRITTDRDRYIHWHTQTRTCVDAHTCTAWQPLPEPSGGGASQRPTRDGHSTLQSVATHVHCPAALGSSALCDALSLTISLASLCSRHGHPDLFGQRGPRGSSSFSAGPRIHKDTSVKPIAGFSVRTRDRHVFSCWRQSHYLANYIISEEQMDYIYSYVPLYMCRIEVHYIYTRLKWSIKGVIESLSIMHAVQMAFFSC